MMSVPGIPGSSSESLPTANSKPAETEMNPLREIASVMMVRLDHINRSRILRQVSYLISGLLVQDELISCAASDIKILVYLNKYQYCFMDLEL